MDNQVVYGCFPPQCHTKEQQELMDKQFKELLAARNNAKLEQKEKEPCIICISDWCDSKPTLSYYDATKMPFTIEELIDVMWCEDLDPYKDLHVRWMKYFYDGVIRETQIYTEKAGLKPKEPLPFKVSYILQIDSANW